VRQNAAALVREARPRDEVAGIGVGTAGKTPTSPTVTEPPVKVTAEPPRIAKGAAAPRGTWAPTGEVAQSRTAVRSSMRRDASEGHSYVVPFM